MTVIAPTDSIESKKATTTAAIYKGPVYMRFGREKVPVITTENTPFKIGRAEVYREGKDVSVVACGSLVYEALMAAEKPIKSDKRLLITERKCNGSKIIVVINFSEDKIFLKKYVNKNNSLSGKCFNGLVEPYGVYIIVS